jgi:hypothetical protein
MILKAFFFIFQDPRPLRSFKITRESKEVFLKSYFIQSAYPELLVRDPRVHNGITDVHNQICHHEDGNKNQKTSLDDRIVAAVDSVHKKPPDARKVEDGFC